MNGLGVVRLAAPLVAGALLLTGCGSVLPQGPAATPAPAPAPAAPPAPGDGTTMTDPAQGYRPAQELKFDGLADGLVTNAKVDCTRINPTTYAWMLTGDIGGTKLELTFNTNRFRGAGQYPVSGIGESGVMTMTFGDRTAATDAAHTGTFTLEDDGETGSINATLNSPRGQQRVTGPWSCTAD